MKRVFFIFLILMIIILGIIVGVYWNKTSMKHKENNEVENVLALPDVTEENKLEISKEIVSKEEKTTPNTLMIFSTYYTKCKHYINDYQEVDANCVNLEEEDLAEKYREWKIISFSEEQVTLEKEEDGFCNQHYKLKLMDDRIIIFEIDEENNEKEYEITEITSEYLTAEDILKLKEGILVFGKENLTAVLEDYE